MRKLTVSIPVPFLKDTAVVEDAAETDVIYDTSDEETGRLRSFAAKTHMVVSDTRDKVRPIAGTKDRIASFKMHRATKAQVKELEALAAILDTDPLFERLMDAQQHAWTFELHDISPEAQEAVRELIRATSALTEDLTTKSKTWLEDARTLLSYCDRESRARMNAEQIAQTETISAAYQVFGLPVV